MTDISYRQATIDDAPEIHALLLRLAPEMPLLVDTLEREEALYALTRNCVRSGESWVACDTAADTIIGFALLELSGHGRHYAEHEVLELRHAGIASEHRRRGAFTALIAQAQLRLLPIVARISPQNQSGAAAAFERLGFREAGTTGEHSLRWQPG
ncbi:MAG: GNAT family N-acetyltransferase [Alphaproteobacteria bacterium]|nr:GNAT family N-acetyltransferase [Alphaproteobacteria bacterium]